jgi:hypothetical protein
MAWCYGHLAKNLLLFGHIEGIVKLVDASAPVNNPPLATEQRLAQLARDALEHFQIDFSGWLGQRPSSWPRTGALPQPPIATTFLEML